MNTNPMGVPYKCDRRGRCWVPLEKLWDGVRLWAKQNGKVYNESYGVEGVAAT